MSNEMNLPLTIVRYSGGYAIDDANGQEITGWIEPEHAAHIVRCVNAHDGLVEALQEAMQMSVKFSKDTGIRTPWLNKAQAALAKAQGDQDGTR